MLVQSWDIPTFIKEKWLSTYDFVSIKADSRTQQLISSLKKRGADGDYQVKEMDAVLNKRPSIERLYNCVMEYAHNRKGFVYAININHARSIAEYYQSQGVHAVAIDSHTPVKERERIISSFRSGGLQVLVNVDIFSEGFDCPDVEFIQLARPTLSLAKYLQMVGRGLRPHKKKECCVILDNVGLVRLFGLPTRCWNWQSAFEGRIKIKDERLKSRDERLKNRDNHSSLINNQEINSFSLVIAHEQLEQLINDAELEEWNNRQGIAEEAAEAFRSENGKLWGLRRGGMMMVEPKYLRVFNIKEGLAAVRLQDNKLAVVDMKGNIVRGLGNGISVRICSKDFAEVERNNDYEYIDLLSGQIYYDLPRIVSEKEPQLMRASSNGLILRLKDPFVYGSINEDAYFKPVKEYNYFYMIYMKGFKADVERYAVDTLTLIVIKGDNERAYWLYDVHEDGSIDVIDRQCNAYHVMPDGTKEKLNRCDILEHSQAVLKEIAIQYRKEGGDPNDQYNMYHFRNRILYNRLSEKLKVLKNKHKP